MMVRHVVLSEKDGEGAALKEMQRLSVKPFCALHCLQLHCLADGVPLTRRVERHVAPKSSTIRGLHHPRSNSKRALSGVGPNMHSCSRAGVSTAQTNQQVLVCSCACRVLSPPLVCASNAPSSRSTCAPAKPGGA